MICRERGIDCPWAYPEGTEADPSLYWGTPFGGGGGWAPEAAPPPDLPHPSGSRAPEQPVPRRAYLLLAALAGYVIGRRGVR